MKSNRMHSSRGIAASLFAGALTIGVLSACSPSESEEEPMAADDVETPVEPADVTDGMAEDADSGMAEGEMPAASDEDEEEGKVRPPGDG